MYKFGKTSQARLDTCHEDIQKIMNELIKIYDISILEGLRSAERQQELYHQGRSKLDGVNKKSKHQDDGTGVSRAIDIMPYKKGTNPFSGKEKDKARFYFMMGIVYSIAEKLYENGEISHKIRFGLDWDGDHTFDDQNFDDLPHMELVKIK